MYFEALLLLFMKRVYTGKIKEKGKTD